jgi:hypothetical protein
MTPTELAEQFSNFVNRATREEREELAKAMTYQHRTLVQAQFGVFLSFAKELADQRDAGNYDARNAYAGELSKKIMNLTNGMTGVPFV